MTQTVDLSSFEPQRREMLAASAVAALAALGLSVSDSALADALAGRSQPGAPDGSPGEVAVERRGAVQMIEIRWPKGRNRLDPHVIIGLGKAYWQLEHDDGLRVGLLYATGSDFCAGLDIAAYVAAQASGLLPPKEPVINPLGLRAPLRTKPVVVAVHGRTQSVGHELFLATDVRVASSDTVFGQLEVTRGLFPGGGATVRFPREAGWANAMRYMLTGDEWGADEALRMGLLQAVTRPGRQLSRAVELADKIAVAAPLGVRGAYAQSRRALLVDEPTAMAEMQSSFGAILQTADAKESLRAQQEGRSPVFRGL
jgi:enoyl-CoA hydratase/carnithine racemase